MFEKKPGTLVPSSGGRDPFVLLRQMTSELDHVFDDWPSFRWPAFRSFAMPEPAAWSPKIDVFTRDNYLVTRVDLPGMKKEDVTVEVSDGYLMLTGERKRETERKPTQGQRQPLTTDQTDSRHGFMRISVNPCFGSGKSVC